MTAAERAKIRASRISVVTAKPGDSVASLSSRQPFPGLNEQRFRALNNIGPAENVVPGTMYKVIVE
jgi:predicted Zn-dependent protease